MTIRVGLLGLSHGERVHLPAYKANPRYEVVAVCARTPGRAEAVAREHGIPIWTTDARRLISAPEVDLVSIATPPWNHAGYAAAALAAGKHAVVEVGFVGSTADARILVEMASTAGRVGAVAFVLRYLPNLRLVGDLLAQAIAGAPRLLRLDYYSSVMAGPAAQWLAERRWQRGALSGGGVLAGHLAHALDLAMCWFGPVAEVDATLATLAEAAGWPPRREPAEDSGALTLHFASGLLGVFTWSAAVAHSRTQFEVHGPRGSLLVEGFGDEVAFLPMGSEAAQPRYPPPAYLEETRGQHSLPGGFAIFLDRLAQAITDGRQPPDLPTFLAGLEVTRVIDAAHLAARERRRVSLAEIG